jgi:hypothetical protein
MVRCISKLDRAEGSYERILIGFRVAKTDDVMPSGFRIRRHMAARAGRLLGEDNDSFARLYFNLEYLATFLTSQFPYAPVHQFAPVRAFATNPDRRCLWLVVSSDG